MRIYREENFAPISGVTAFDALDEVVELANDTEYGLVAYICASRVDVIWPLMRRLEFAMVSINGSKFTGAPIPFGGMKESGLGRERSEEHVRTPVTNAHLVCRLLLEEKTKQQQAHRQLQKVDAAN